MPNTKKKHAANFYLNRELTDRIKVLAKSMDVSSSAIVAICLTAGLPTIETMAKSIGGNARTFICQL